ncbi:ABC transporter permease subunit [Jeotgalibacillus sp. R-1-5s-1]|uniref:ABC transporter permease subunit n=1 Tax=Jeotgalibacillus sp. R-1-5s-1 TaxID=2555897 RepID=UPI00141AC1B4|nr:ABC transporter permease subunit [Jeotgalibacillus sp. R-1-5s-1]
MKWYQTSKPAVLLIPALLFLLLIVYSLVMAFAESIRSPEGWTWAYYGELFMQRRLIESLGYSLSITFVSVFLSVLIGWAVVRWFYSFIDEPGGKWLVWIPMLFPHFVWGYFVLLLLGQSGLISSFFYQAGWLSSREAFPVLTQDAYGVGIIITYLWKEIPFVILMLLPAYLQLPKQYGEVIAVLGGGRKEWFKTVEWPWVQPVIVEITLILTAFIFTAYEVPALLGISYPQMTAVLAYDWFYGAAWEERSYAFGLLCLIAFILGAIALLSFALMNRRRWLLSKSSHQY